jgi:hypothetical protein
VNRHTESDSNGNSYTDLTARNSTTRGIQIHYVLNPTVGASDTATATTSVGYPAVWCGNYSGAHASSSFDQQNGAVDNGTFLTSISTGSVTPGENNELVIAAQTHSSVAGTIPTGYTSRYAGSADANSVGLQVGEQIQTTATATNPSFTNSPNSLQLAAVIATFKEAAAATGQPFAKRWGGIPHNGLRKSGVW